MKVRELPSDPRYRVSDQGDVFGPRGHVLKGEIHYTSSKDKGKQPYRAVRITNGKRRYVHHLVLETFVGAKPDGLCRRHKNGNSLDNRLENLTYATYSENNYDRVAHGKHFNANKTHCIRKHKFTPENTYINTTSGCRQCRACARLRQPEKNAARRAARQRLKTLAHNTTQESKEN